MRESFIFHLSFIENLPAERKTEFIQYVVNYGFFEEEPILDDMALAFWKTIKQRIDTDKQQYTERVEKQNEARKKYREKIKAISCDILDIPDIADISDNPKNPKSKEISGNILPNSHSEFEFDNEFEFEFEFDIDNEFDAKNSLTPPQKNYSNEIFKLWHSSGLPGSKDEFSFMCKEFKNSIKALKGLHSKDVLQACKNYISVITDKSCFYSRKLCFDSFVNNKIFNEMLPDRFVKENYKKFDNSGITNDADVSQYSFKKVEAHGKQN